MSETKTDALSIGAKYQTSAVGLVAKGKAATYGQWEVALSVACGIAKNCPWWIGDLLNIGEHTYGEMFSQAAGDTGFDPAYLANLKWVCSRIELSRRREQLSFSHHQEVASLDPKDQDMWLGHAVDNKWTRAQLREAMREGKEEEGGEDEGNDDLVEVMHDIEVYLNTLGTDSERLAAVKGLERRMKKLEKKYGGTA
jgi:hypothetical protein